MRSPLKILEICACYFRNMLNIKTINTAAATRRAKYPNQTGILREKMCNNNMIRQRAEYKLIMRCVHCSDLTCVLF